jgi:acyl-coenzyme A synthetase/AMP-(fatty) acid ligase
MPNHKRPRAIMFVDALPKTPVGKIQEAVIRREYWGTLKR